MTQRDDHLQGILFSRSQTVRFREVALPLQPLPGLPAAKTKQKHHRLNPQAMALMRHRDTRYQDTEIGDYIDYVATTIEQK